MPSQPFMPAVGLAPDLNLNVGRDVAGPASYVAGTGQTVPATALGMKKIYSAWSMGVSSDGLNFVEITTPSGPQTNQIVLRWSVAATGAEVGNGVNLSGKKIRIMSLGV